MSIGTQILHAGHKLGPDPLITIPATQLVEMQFGSRTPVTSVVPHELEDVRPVPSDLIQDEDDVGVLGNIAGFLGQALVHGMGAAPSNDKSSSLALFGAGGTQDIGQPGSLVVRHRML